MAGRGCRGGGHVLVMVRGELVTVVVMVIASGGCGSRGGRRHGRSGHVPVMVMVKVIARGSRRRIVLVIVVVLQVMVMLMVRRGWRWWCRGNGATGSLRRGRVTAVRRLMRRGRRLYARLFFRLLVAVDVHQFLYASTAAAVQQQLALFLGDLLEHELLLPLDGLLLLLERVLLLEPSAAPQVRPVVEHVVRVRVQRPIAALARFLVVARLLDETLVQAQIVPDRVLPALLVLPVVREPLHDELVDTVERAPFVRRVLYGHRYQGDVRIGRLDHVLGRGRGRRHHVMVVMVVRRLVTGRRVVSVPGVLLVRARIRGRVGRARVHARSVVRVLVAEQRVHDDDMDIIYAIHSRYDGGKKKNYIL